MILIEDYGLIGYKFLSRYLFIYLLVHLPDITINK